MITTVKLCCEGTRYVFRGERNQVIKVHGKKYFDTFQDALTAAKAVGYRTNENNWLEKDE